MKTLVLIGFVCVLAAVGLIQPTSAEVVPVYVKLGGELVLLPNTSSVTLPITGILWLHGQNKVTEWDTAFGEEVDYYGTYRNRTDLNKETAKLVVRNLLERDNGVYSVTINGLGQSTSFETKFIVDVPKPRVILKPLTCSVEHSTQCTLSCEGELTETTGPVDYRWMKIVGDKSEWLSDTTQTLTIINDAETNKIQKFACEMKNPVSVLQSDLSDNRLYVPPPDPPLSSIILPILLIIAVSSCLLGAKLNQNFREMFPDPITDCLKKCLCIKDADKENGGAVTTGYSAVGPNPTDVERGNGDATADKENGGAVVTGYSAVGTNPTDDSAERGNGDAVTSVYSAVGANPTDDSAERGNGGAQGQPPADPPGS